MNRPSALGGARDESGEDVALDLRIACKGMRPLHAHEPRGKNNNDVCGLEYVVGTGQT